MTRAPKRVAPAAVDLTGVAAHVEGALDAALEHIGPYDAADYWDRRRSGQAALVTVLQERLQAKIDQRYDACRVRIAGVASSSTSGLEGALRNWMAAARRKAAA